MATTLGTADLIYVAAFLLIAVIAGHTAVSAVLRTATRHWAELGGLSVAAGIGLTALWLMAASLLGFKPTRGVLACGAAVTAVGAAASLWRVGRPVLPTVPSRFRPDLSGVVGILGAAAVLVAIGNVWAETASPGLPDIDEYASWMLKAKILFAAPLHPVPAALRDPGLSYSHQDYPLLLPLVSAGCYAATGRVDESAAKLALFPMYLSLVAILYGGARRTCTRAVAVAVTAVAVAAPVVVSKAGLLVGELPVTLFLGAAASMLACWATTGERASLVLAGGFGAAAAFSKNEGLAALPVYGLAALGFALCQRVDRKRRLTDWALAATTAIVLLTPWLAYRLALPRTHEDYGGKFLSAEVVAHGLARLPHVLRTMATWAVDLSSAGALWVVLAGVSLIGWRAHRAGRVRLLWAVLAGQLGLYVLAFLVTPWDLDTLLNMVTPKLLAQASPLADLLVALCMPSLGFGRNDAGVGAERG